MRHQTRHILHSHTSRTWRALYTLTLYILACMHNWKRIHIYLYKIAALRSKTTPGAGWWTRFLHKMPLVYDTHARTLMHTLAPVRVLLYIMLNRLNPHSVPATLVAQACARHAFNVYNVANALARMHAIKSLWRSPHRTASLSSSSACICAPRHAQIYDVCSVVKTTIKHVVYTAIVVCPYIYAEYLTTFA